MQQSKLQWWSVVALAACIAPVIILGVAGCGGGNEGGLSGGVQQTGSFTGPGNAGAGQTGTFSLQTLSDNTVRGSIVVTSAPAPARKLTAVTSLPQGTYNFTGTRDGDSFTPTGTFTGTPSFQFTVSGTLSNTTSDGEWTISGMINGEPFSFNGVILSTQPTGGSGSFNFSLNTSNADISLLHTDKNIGTKGIIAIPQVNILSGTFTANEGTANSRSLSVAVHKSTTIAEGDTFIVNNNSDSGRAIVIYREGFPAKRAWAGNGGAVTVTSVSASSVTFRLQNVHLEPMAGEASPGQPNQATGSFNLGGEGTGIIQ